MKIDWKRKLTSRKFWVAIIGFIVPLMIAFGVSQNDAADIASIIMAGASAVAYIIGEGLVDYKAVNSDNAELESFDDEVGDVPEDEE